MPNQIGLIIFVLSMLKKCVGSFPLRFSCFAHRKFRDQKLKSESVKILESLKASDFVILLDETGTSYSSIDLAKTMRGP